MQHLSIGQGPISGEVLSLKNELNVVSMLKIARASGLKIFQATSWPLERVVGSQKCESLSFDSPVSHVF